MKAIEIFYRNIYIYREIEIIDFDRQSEKKNYDSKIRKFQIFIKKLIFNIEK